MTFIHELMHIWQGDNSLIDLAYLFDALVTHAPELAWGTDFYKYNIGYPWRADNMEQPAQIVEDWHINSMKSTDPRFEYIRDEIR